jgi:hypothetical protein
VKKKTVQNYIQSDAQYESLGKGIDFMQKLVNDDDLTKKSVLGFAEQQVVSLVNILGLRKLRVKTILLAPIFLIGILTAAFILYFNYYFINSFFDEEYKIFSTISIIKFVFTVIMSAYYIFVTKFYHGPHKPTLYMIASIGMLIINRKLVSFISIMMSLLYYKVNPVLIGVYIGVNMLVKKVNSQYTSIDYVSNIIYNPGSCTMNDVFAMFASLMLMYKNKNKYVEDNKLTSRIAKKFDILDIRRPYMIHKYSAPNTEPLTQKGFVINGFYINNNVPHKLHKCFWCETEAVYRQVQSKIDYDDDALEDFRKFIQPKIYELVQKYDFGEEFNLDKYFQKLGRKRKEFEEGLNIYMQEGKYKKRYKMHPKTDEKIYMNYKKFKMKARNIAAQNQTAKILMGMVCEIGMSMLHNEDWCGAGKNDGQRCEIFKKYYEMCGGEVGVICADGSAFDSTQHSGIQNIVDKYFFDLIITNHPELEQYGNLKDFRDVCFQQKFVIYSDYYTYKCEGTQMSGRMNTCLGNTLRSWAYIEYIKYKMKQQMSWINLERINEMVLGDDQIIFLPKYLMDKYEEFAYKYVYAKEDIPIKHGLGQIAKIFDKYPNITGAEFLSKNVLFDPINNEFYLVRKLERFFQLTPFTFRNKLLNVNLFRLGQAELLQQEATNILSGKPLLIFKKYAYKMIEIAQEEIRYINSHYQFKREQYDKIKKMLKDDEELRKYKGHYVGYTKDVENFEEIYLEFLEKRYNITQDDINEYFSLLDKINSNNYLSKEFRLHMIDKLMDVTSSKEYENVKKEIDKTSVEVDITLKRNVMVINEYSKY